MTDKERLQELRETAQTVIVLVIIVIIAVIYLSRIADWSKIDCLKASLVLIGCLLGSLLGKIFEED